MGNLLKIVTSLHKSTSRNYIERMCDNKIECMKKAKKYDFDYWDGDRRYGYGGYKYIPGRWKAVAEKLIAKYSLTNNSSILDIGCGKGFLLYEIKLILPRINLVGIDISAYAINNCKEEVKENIFYHDIKNSLSFNNKNFDLVLSLNCFHNLKIFDLSTALKEMERVGKNGYLLVESFRNEAELFNLECWALTCQSFYSPEEWLWIFEKNGYSGDYEFIYFE
jgi:ubiquinone/menaquinone biosynthesis C-methylase UbiE